MTGTVLIEGELADSGTVTFHPVEVGPPAVGRIHSDGSYSVRVGQGDLSDPDGGTLAPGEYRVTVVVRVPTGEAISEGGPPAAGPRLTAKKYASEQTTDLRYEVKPGDNMFVLKLDRAEPTSEPDEQAPAEAAERPSVAPAANGQGADSEQPAEAEGETTDGAHSGADADQGPDAPGGAADESKTEGAE